MLFGMRNLYILFNIYIRFLSIYLLKKYNILIIIRDINGNLLLKSRDIKTISVPTLSSDSSSFFLNNHVLNTLNL